MIHNVTIVYDTPENAMQALQQLQKQKGSLLLLKMVKLLLHWPYQLRG